MNELNELMRVLRKRYKDFLREAKHATTDELEIIYRAKASEAEAIYILAYNMKMQILKERARNADAEING